MKKNIQLFGIFLVFLSVISLSVLISCGGDFTDPFAITPLHEHQLDRSKWIGLSKFHLYYWPERGSGYDEIGFHPRESDWILARHMGFNIFRVAVDYRFIYSPTTGTSTGTFDPHTHDHLGNPVSYVGYLDKMVEYGIKYGIVTNIDLHHAPGFSQADLDDNLQLWANSDGTLPANSGIPHFIAVWDFIAKRYAHVPDEYLHFNLVNEPPQGIFNGNSARAVANRKILSDTIKAIRAVPGNENRLIVLDCNQRYPFNIDQLDLDGKDHELMLSPHCYFPWSFTHEGMNNTTAFPAGFAFKSSGLVWPIRNYFNGFLYGPGKSQELFNKINTFAVFENPDGFNAGTVTLRVVRQSQANTVRIRVDGNLIDATLSIPVVPGLVSQSFTFNGTPIPQGATKVELFVSSGDWLNMDQYTISGVNINCTNIDWGYLPGPHIDVKNDHWTDAQFIRNTMFPSPEWDDLVANNRVRIGEMSSLTQTASGATQRANLLGDYVDAFQGMPMIFWEFKGGAMCIFNLDQNVVFTHPIEITFGEGQRITYYYDKKWYDKIAHRLDLPENK